MKFSDDDLNELKKDLKKLDPQSGECLRVEDLNAIIARLEAAEKLVPIIEDLYKFVEHPKAKEALISWRKESGK